MIIGKKKPFAISAKGWSENQSEGRNGEAGWLFAAFMVLTLHPIDE